MRMQRVPSTDKDEIMTDGDNDDLFSQPYYFDDIDAAKSVQILKQIKKVGAFLVRKRTADDCQTKPYALSVYCSDSKIGHLRINKEPDGKFTLDTIKDPKKTHIFNSVPEMIRYLDINGSCPLSLKHCDAIKWIKLNYSNMKKENDDQYLEYLPYFWPNSNKDEIGKKLKDIGENETFFIRKLNDNEQTKDHSKALYELSVYHKKHVYQLKIFKSEYEEYSVQMNDLSFDSIPELVKYYNYKDLRILPDTYTKLKIYSKYIQNEDS